MNSSCVAVVGNLDNGGVVFSNNQIISCSFIENLSTLPNGRIKIKVPSLGLDELINLPSGVGIKITLSNFEDPDSIPSETTMVLNGTVVKHYSANGGDGVFGQFSTYVVEFIVAGPNLSFLQLLKGQAILSDSFTAIKKLGSLTKSTILFDDSSIKTQDQMKWLIVNRNLVTGIDLITSRSYINNDDAMFVSYRADNTIRIGTLATSFNSSQKQIGYVYANSRYNIVNTPTQNNNSKNLIYGSFSVSHSSAIKQSMASAGMTMLSLPTGKSNKTKTQLKGVMPTGTNVPGNNKVNGNTLNLIYRQDAYMKYHPNTHDYYDMAPIIRDAVFSNYSHQIDIIASGESLVNVGDVVNVMVPTTGTIESGKDDMNFSKVLSGKYFVHSKLYHIDTGDIFYVKLSLIKSDITYDTSNYKTLFGIDPSKVK